MRARLPGYHRYISVDLNDKLETLPLESRTPSVWARAVLTDPIALLIDHAFLEKKAAQNAGVDLFQPT